MKILDKVVIAGNGALSITLTFIAVMFRPLPGQLLTGTVIEQNDRGLTVGMTNSVSVWVPCGQLMSPQKWDQQSRKWLWQMPPNDEFLYYETGQ